LELDVFFLPSSLVHTPATAEDVYIVIDLIRATTSMAVMFDRGARRIFAAGTIEQARAARQIYPQRLLCGERNVKPLPGFDYGNSPVQFSQADLHNRELIMTTTNGTRAFHACPSNAVRLAGSLYNAEAVAAKALQMATERQVSLHLVCAGERDAFGLDDAVCAGYLARELQRQAGQIGQSLHVNDSVKVALALYATFAPPRLIENCNAAREVIEGGLPADPPFCMRTNQSQSVGMVVEQEEETGLLIIECA
jgi:2-phosphosulfolactate phosphatase